MLCSENTLSTRLAKRFTYQNIALKIPGNTQGWFLFRNSLRGLFTYDQ